MTRLFREGRTETVRSCSNESSAFVKALENGEVLIDYLFQLSFKEKVQHFKLLLTQMPIQALVKNQYIFTANEQFVNTV